MRLSVKKAVLILSALLLFSLLIYLYYYISKPKQIAEEFLKTTRLHNYEKLFSLSSIDLLKSYRTEGILINLIDWKFIDKKRITKEKRELDLSEKAFDDWIKWELEHQKAASVDDLVLLKLMKLLSKEADNYKAWRSDNIRTKKAFQEGEKYYYYEDVNRVEYLLDIKCTNKLGMELKNKYILVVEKDYDGKWKVARFHER